MKWIERSNEGEGHLLAYVPLNALHGPHYVAAEYRARYGQLDHSLTSFFGIIADGDENGGKLDRMWQANGLYDNTILIFMTDNGGTTGTKLCNAAMRDSRVSLYEGGTYSLPHSLACRVPHRLQFPEKWDSCVLWSEWRLVHGDELYNITSDPGQEKSIIAEAPTERMKGYYERWWRDVELMIDEPVYISIGSENEALTILI